MSRPTSLMLGLLIICLTTPSLAQTVYSQAPYRLFDYRTYYTPSSSNAIDLYAGGRFLGADGPYNSYDDFTLTSAAQVGEVDWQGVPMANPISGVGYQGADPSTFTIEFLRDNAGIPGAIIDTQTVSAVKTYVGTIELFDAGDTEYVYSYSATLAATPLLQAGTKYWISIIGNTTGTNSWGWESGGPGNGMFYVTDGTASQFLEHSGFHPYDLAFSLGAAPTSAVPEPGPIALLAAGMTGAGLFLRRCRKQMQTQTLG